MNSVIAGVPEGIWQQLQVDQPQINEMFFQATYNFILFYFYFILRMTQINLLNYHVNY